jgi:O-antigen/teichoic acid export membrane protein
VAAPQSPVREGLRGWWFRGGLGLALLIAFIVLVELAPWRLSPRAGWWIVGMGAPALVVGAVIAFWLAEERESKRLTRLAGASQTRQAALQVFYQAGLPLLGGAFFLFWTGYYLGAWAYDQSAFAGLDKQPRFADFFYYAVKTAFLSPPDDIVAHTRGARAGTMIELLAGIGLLGAYLSRFFRDAPRAER